MRAEDQELAGAEGYLSSKFIRNAWYVAAWDHELPQDGLLARTLLGEPLVFYRTAEGRAVALADRCPHRAAPLSLGRREGDGLRCQYHGMKFNADGQGYREWIEHKRKVNAGKSWIKVGTGDISMFRNPGKEEYVVVTFEQDYRSSNLSGQMKKRQYWIKEGGRWKIVYEGAA